MTGWQPIESAPRDGADFIGYERIGDNDRILTMRYDQSRKRFHINVTPFIWFDPTHWMPLPPPPEQSQ